MRIAGIRLRHHENSHETNGENWFRSFSISRIPTRRFFFRNVSRGRLKIINNYSTIIGKFRFKTDMFFFMSIRYFFFFFFADSGGKVRTGQWQKKPLLFPQAIRRNDYIYWRRISQQTCYELICRIENHIYIYIGFFILNIFVTHLVYTRFINHITYTIMIVK